MTIAQYKAIMDGKSFKEDVHYILAGENTKINSARFEKVELDEANQLLRCYLLSPKSTKDNPKYDESFVVDIAFVLAVQFKYKNGNELFQSINEASLIEY